MFQFLSNPYPRNNDFHHRLRVTLFSGLLVAVILIFIFSIRSGISPVMAGNFLLFGLVTCAAMAFFELLLPAVFKNYFSEEYWTVGKNILFWTLLVLMITLGNLLLAHYLYNVPLSAASMFKWFYYTVGIGFLVNGAFSMFYYKRMLKQNESGAAELNREILQHEAEQTNAAVETPEVKPKETGKLFFVAENGKDEYAFTPDEILYIESADNYSKVVTAESHGMNQIMIRSTLKRMEEQCKGHPSFFRCHRGYIVNVDKVVSVKGNSQGYRLCFNEVHETVPVARSMNEELKKRIRK